MSNSILRVVCSGFLTALALSFGMADAHAAAPSDAPARSESPYRKAGLLGPVRVGPAFGVGAPEGLRLSLVAKYKGIVAAGVAGAMIPPLSVPGMGNAKVTRVSSEAFVRVHPFRKAFFVGVAGGVAKTGGMITDQQQIGGVTQPVAATAEATTVYVAPQLGFSWMFSFGMTVGCDVGVEFPVASNGPSFATMKNGVMTPEQGTGGVADALRAATTGPIPVVHLVEIGFLL